MSAPNTDNQIFRFDEPGSLAPPGPIGRIVRFFLGAYLLWNCYLFAIHVGPRHVTNITVLVWFGVAFWLVPYVVNIGWGCRWGMWPRVVLIAIWSVAMLVEWSLSGNLLGPYAWYAVKWSSFYVMGHLGVSFALSSLIATPGCEMRSIPHLFGILRGEKRQEHYCPGFIDRVDRWEHSRRSARRGNPSS